MLTYQKKLKNAIKKYDKKTIIELLKDKEEKIINNDYFILFATINGYLDIIELLVLDGRFDPTTLRNEAIRQAKSQNENDIVSLLWKDKRVKNTLEEHSQTLYRELIKEDLKFKVKQF